MSEGNWAETQAAVERLVHSDLSEFQWLDDGGTVRLGFTFAGHEGGEGYDVTVTLLGVEEMYYTRVHSAAISCFVTAAGIAHIKKVPEHKAELMYFTVEGEAKIQVTCHEIRVVEEKQIAFVTAPRLTDATESTAKS